jgi:hypothetical protein
MEQALVPALQGANSNSMLGYVLGAQLQRQADQMGYDREMDQYNLTARDEAQRVQEQQAADRQAQRDNAITAALVNRHGAAFAPEGYTLTPEQRRIGTEFANANVALLQSRAERAGRSGTGTGTGSNAQSVRDARTVEAHTRSVEALMRDALTVARRNPNNLEPQRMIGGRPDPNNPGRTIGGIADPNHRPGLRPELVAQIEAAAAERGRQQFPQARQWAAQPATPAAQAAPAATPQAAPPVARTDPGTPTAPASGTAPRNSSEALQRGLVTPERLNDARRGGNAIARIEADGTIVVRTPNGTEQRMPK